MKKYNLIWSDEFNYQGSPDPEKWSFHLGGHGWGNKESQNYTDSLKNCGVEKGLLKICARKENHGNNSYTSARIHTFGKFSFKYGRIAVRARLPEGRGTWPAIWLLGNSIRQGKPWPLCGEIDMMEYAGQRPEEIIFSLHTQAYNHRLDNHRTYTYHVPSLSQEFHEYAMDWTKDYLEFFFDNKPIVRYTRGERLLDTNLEGWPFDDEFFLIINLAIGGTLGGVIDDEIFPACFEIDFVRVYDIIEV